MGKYEEALGKLNAAQRQAVETIDGPVLVIAGPGTGKTQLLSTRIAHILSTTDTLPENILCLTFTESAAHNMRQRLSGMIGQAAYKITISTYHAFGSELIRRYPDYFAVQGELQPIDDLGIDTLFRTIVGDLPYDNPLKYADTYLNDIKAFVSDAKRALLTPQDIREVASTNQAFIDKAQPVLQESLASFTRVSKTSVALFAKLLAGLEEIDESRTPTEGILPLGRVLISELRQALDEVEETSKTTPLTKWKNRWLVKDTSGKFCLDGTTAHKKLLASADVYEQYLTALAEQRLFDYDDMILRAIRGLQEHSDLRFTLQERYLYVLLDEFQDTNSAQLRLIELLTDNPVHEGRPNVLAVGDDDQAIYAFQGADYSHMLQFQKMYRDVLLVPLTENYRSHHDVLTTAGSIAEQIEERLHHHFPEIQKTLVARNQSLADHATVQRHEAQSDVAQFAWAAKKIRELIDSGTPANEIAVLAPQHKYLEPLVPFLQEQAVPVRYDKRENILEDPIIQQLIQMSRLVCSLKNKDGQSNALWCEVLSFPFWQLPTSLIWKLSWQANDTRTDWTETLLKDEKFGPIALFFIGLSFEADSENLETMLDYLIGAAPYQLKEPDHTTFTSPLYQYYFGAKQADIAMVGSFWELLTNLTVLRARLREYQTGEAQVLHLQDFITFVEAHRAANIKILNTSPYQEAQVAVQLMTAFKAKGMEFATVFVLAVNDEAWGTKARSQSSRLSLPANLQHIRYGGATSDERLRLFYVALTRAKTTLYLLSYAATYAGTLTNRLQYLNEYSDENKVISPLLPAASREVLPAEVALSTLQPTTELATYWHQRHEKSFSRDDAKALLKPRLEKFQLSPTHVNAFIDLENAGPQSFFMNTILRFPKAPIAEGQFGNAMHETLEWIHLQNKKLDKMPTEDAILHTFDRVLQQKRLNTQLTKQFGDKGHDYLRAYLAQRGHTIHKDNRTEHDFRSEGVFIGNAHMAGKIDKLIIDEQAKTIAIVDYKTGKSYTHWEAIPKLHKYRQQLYLYKALVEGSHSFKGYTVTDAYLEFLKPNEEGKIQELHLVFNDADYWQIRALAERVWDHVQTLTLPDISAYPRTLSGIKQFELFLLTSLVTRVGDSSE